MERGAKEFRIVIGSIKGLNFDRKRAIDFTDYYLKRSKRIRKIGRKILSEMAF